jgi:hypothetical protein
MIQYLWRTVWKFLKKIKMELAYDPTILVHGLDPNKLKLICQSDICIPMCIKVLLTMAKIWKQNKCSWTDEWIRKMWYIHTGKYYSSLK